MGPDYSGRVKRLKRVMKKDGLGAVMISSIRDIEYFTGTNLSGDFAFLLVDSKAKPSLNVSCLSNYKWDTKTAKPSKKKLLDLGLDDIARELWPES